MVHFLGGYVYEAIPYSLIQSLYREYASAFCQKCGNKIANA